ncbi:MAG TPA: YhjD/YihY/BrkB family envelope integrity protein [Phycisphaerales bacterium]|nr:YhjD/YihY/BrkB family envelope integrity protein [Phycisphaerales bacterium]
MSDPVGEHGDTPNGAPPRRGRFRGALDAARRAHGWAWRVTGGAGDQDEDAPRVAPAWRSRLGLAGGVVDFLHWWWQAIMSDSLTRMAAALTYRTIFSLIPILVLGLVVLRMFRDTDELVRELMGRIVAYLGLENIVTPADPAAGPVAGPQRSSAADWVQDLAARVQQVNFQAISVVGVMVLAYAAIGLLVELERDFNQVYGVARGRSWVRRAQQYWFTITLGPIFLWASFWVEDQFRSNVTRVAERSGLGTQSMFVQALGFLATVVISWMMLLLIYISVPNTKVRLKPALLGALSAAVLWEISKRLFTAYLGFATTTVTLYGSLALIPLSLMWIYATWLVVLAGLSVTYALQHGVMPRGAASGAEAMRPLVISPTVALDIQTAVAEQFARGKVPSAAWLAHHTGIEERIVRRVLGRLVARGLLRRVGEPGRTEGYVLGRPADAIDAAEVLEVGFGLSAPSGGGSSSERALLDELRAAQLSRAQGVTLARLAGRSDPLPPATIPAHHEPVRRSPPA